MKSKNNTSIYYSSVRAIVFVLLCFAGYAAYCQPATELYSNANNFYKAKQYQQAADVYEKIASQGYKNVEIYYNLGNCYYKLGNAGKSILNYERALKLAPGDEDIKHNLALAQLRVADRVQPMPQLAIITWWNDFVSSNSSKGWGNFALIFVWLSLLAFAISYFFGRRIIFNSLALLFLFLSLTFLYLGSGKKYTEQHSDTAVLMVPTSYVKSAPDDNASDLFLVHEGTELHILDQVGTWNKIRLADGKVGWIEKSDFEKI